MSDNKRETVAVVDDDPRLLESLEELLASAGYEVRAYSSALSLLQGGVSDIDCLVTDVGMPGMDGFELLRLVRALRPDLPVFLVSGLREPVPQRPLSHELEVGRFFSKPFDGNALLAAIEEALRESKAT